MTGLNLVFMGTPDFAVPALQALHKAGHTIHAVYCQPPKPQGRGYALQETPVHRAALQLGVQVRTPKTLRSAEETDFLKAEKLDAIIVAAYGLILPQAVLDAPRLGCLNIHASLLPRWRGAAPIHRAILAGDAESGITIMQMEAGLDTGPMWSKSAIPITSTTTAQSLHDALAERGASMIVETLDLVNKGSASPTPQPEEGVTYAAKLTKADGKIDWTQSAEAIERQIRALTPWPGTFFTLQNETIKLLQAEIVPSPDAKAAAGALLCAKQLIVACGNGTALRLLKIQRPGKGPTDDESFLRGYRAQPDTHLA